MAIKIKLNDKFTKGFIGENEIENIRPQANAALELVKAKNAIF